MDSKHEIKVVAIAGGTASGKSTFATKIADIIKPKNVVYLTMDSYYKNFNELSFEERKKINYDHPDSLDIDLLVQHIHELKQNKVINRPIYDFTHHCRTDKTVTVEPGDVIMLDGILALAISKIRKLSDIKIFIKTEDDIRFIRRLMRDIKERGRDIDNVVDQYLTTVKPMHHSFVEPSIKYADVIVPYYEGNEIAIDLIATKIKSLLKK